MTGLRRFVAISLAVFAVSCTLLVGLLSGCGGGGDDNGGSPTAAQTPRQPTVTASATAAARTPGQPTVTGSTTISAQEVAMHNSPDDCWIIISNKVYDVSSYVKLHPGGASAIMPYCGEEATRAFETKDLSRGEDHSGFAYSHLDSLYVGDLGE
jgi:cytochrome b involved in lipid metabolism